MLYVCLMYSCTCMYVLFNVLYTYLYMCAHMLNNSTPHFYRQMPGLLSRGESAPVCPHMTNLLESSAVGCGLRAIMVIGAMIQPLRSWSDGAVGLCDTAPLR